MNSEQYMERLIRNLGCSYDAMIQENVIEKLPLQDLYEDGTTLEVEPAPGVELVFWPETLRFEMIHIILVDENNTGIKLYRGTLPPPYDSIKNKALAMEILGKPVFSKGPLELHGTGLAGWDTYQIETAIHPAALVEIQYIRDFEVAFIQFSVMDKHV